MGPIPFSLFINDLALHVKNISVDCDMLTDDTTLHTSGKDILQIRSNMQDSLEQVSSWCDENHMVINPIKTKSMAIATRQKHQKQPIYSGCFCRLIICISFNFRSVVRVVSGKINFTALLCREFNLFLRTSLHPSHTTDT